MEKKSLDFELLAETYYDELINFSGYSPYTIIRYRRSNRAYCKFTGITMLSEVTEESVRAFLLDGRVARNWKGSTFRLYYGSLLLFFRWCVRRGYMEENPAIDIEQPRIKKILPNRLTKQDALRLLEVAYNYPCHSKFLRFRNHAILATLIFAGLRKKELINLKWSEMEIENLTIRINDGKGGKDRLIPMSHALAQSLIRYIKERKRLNKTCPEFFASINRNSGLTDHGLKWLVFHMRKASGIKFSFRKLRHTFATLMLEGGCDIYSLSKMMGHADISTTTIYLSATVQHLRSQIVKHPLESVV